MENLCRSLILYLMLHFDIKVIRIHLRGERKLKDFRHTFSFSPCYCLADPDASFHHIPIFFGRHDRPWEFRFGGQTREILVKLEKGGLVMFLCCGEVSKKILCFLIFHGRSEVRIELTGSAHERSRSKESF